MVTAGVQQSSIFTVKPFMYGSGFLALLTVLFTFSLQGQKSEHYMVKLDHDTVYHSTIKMDRKLKTVTCQEGGTKTRYKASDLLFVKADTVVYESGFVSLKPLRPKKYYFLRRTISGPLSLYQAQASRAGWTLKGWAKRRTSEVFFYKKADETRTQFSKTWKKKTRQCDNYQKAATSLKLNDPRLLVLLYNANCH